MSESNLTEKIDNNNGTPSDNSNNNVEVTKNANVPNDDVSDVSPSSGISSASTKSAVSKQSGIRPPSRIGRPCGGIHKPAIPTPTQNSSDDSIRRLTDDFGRHRLTDLMEADESEEDCVDYLKSARRNRYTSIGSTASSMDGLWELHPRRLSEAGLSRHSDSSAVLTEDTDSFIIGQRVWVGGTKPGTIAYIGETQFAPGEWAGIALDEAIGKNDGSVGGIRYFQCENKKGVFSRLTRLTRVPIEQPGMGSNETFTSPNNGVRSSRSPISPTGSTRSLLKSAMSLSTSNTSLTSSATHTDFKNGDRVIIKSTQGSKVGTVRYMGLTDFAPGEWVGVELDDPRGKNDGSVEGKRYFECRPNFGLFAPLSKVSKSPSKYKPTACVVHSGPGLPPSGIKRANSKESMASLVSKTSAASSVRRVRLGVTSLTPKKVTPKTSTPIPTRTALQDVLREKQQHIEQLLKERDLERAEITRAASQADDAEHRFFTLKEDFEKYRAECASKVQENSELLSKLKIDRKELLSQLEDEKRRNEDLQFRFEEAAISNSDIEVVNENYVKKIGKLERSLAEERQKTETLEGTTNKLFEAEEGLIKAREEIDTLKKDLATTRKKKETLEEEQSASSKLLESLQNQIQGASVENEEKTNTISRLNDEISKVTSEHELIKREVEETKKKAGESCQEKDAQIEKLKSEVEHQRKIIVKYEKTHADLVKENEKLKMELSGKSLDAETATDKISTKENEIKSIRNELETVKKALEHKTEESERHKANSVEVEQDLRKELVQTRDDLKEKISEVEKVKKECFVEISQKDQQLQEANKTIAQNSEEIKKLSSELNDTKASFETSKNDIHSRHARQVASQDSQLMALSAELQQKNEEITKSSIVISKLEEDLCTKNGVIEKLRLELESFESQKSSHTETSTTLTMKITELTLHNGDLERKLSGANDRVAELLQLKDRLEAEIRALTARCVNSDQIEQFRNEIQIKENLLGTLRAEFEEKLHASERLRHELELQFETTVAGFEQLRRDLESKLQVSTQSEALLRQRCDSSITELGGVRDEFRRKIDELQRLLQEREFALSNLQGKASESDRYYQEQLRTVTEELNQNLQSCQQRISILTDETSQLKEQLSRKSEQIIEVQAESSHIVAQCQQIEKELKQKYGEDIKRLEFELNEKTLQIQKTEEVLKLVRTDCHSTNVDLEAKDRRIGELTAEVQQGQKLLVQLQDQFSSIQLLHEQKTKESEGVQSQCQGLLEQVAYLTEQVRTGEDLFKNVQIEHNNAMQLVHRLRITEQQKQQCLQQLQLEVTSHSGNKNCNNVIELLNQVKVENSPENTEKILSLLRDIDIIKNQLAERNHQYDVQNGELLRLQQELLKAQELNGRCVQQDQNLVSFNATYTTKHNTLHGTQPSYPLELQVQLTILKNAFSELSQRFDSLRKENNHLLARLQNALNGGNAIDINNVLLQLAEANQRYKNFKNTIQVDNYNMQKTIQYSMLQLQEKDRVLNHQVVEIKRLQQILRGLPTQCRNFAVLSPNEIVGNDCSALTVDNKRITDLLQVKTEEVLDLRKQISSLLNDCSRQCETKICVDKPCICSKQTNTVFTPTPPKIIRVMVPVVQPKVIIKEIFVPQVEGKRCPPPTIQRIEVPKVIIQKVPLEVPVAENCRLPDLTTLSDSNLVEEAISRLDLSSFNSYETVKFKQTLLSLVGRQRNCIAPNFKVGACVGLPQLRIPQGCTSLSAIVDNLTVNGYRADVVDSYKQSLFQLLSNVQDCATSDSNASKIGYLQNIIDQQTLIINNLRETSKSCTKLPVLTLPQACLSPVEIVNKIYVEGHSPSDLYSYKQSLLQVLKQLQQCSIKECATFGLNVSKIGHLQNIINQQSLIINNLRETSKSCSKLPVLSLPQACLSPVEIVNNIYVEGYSPSDLYSYRQSLLQVLRQLQQCSIKECATCDSNASKIGHLQNIIDQQTLIINNLRETSESSPKLPVLRLPQACLSPVEIVNNIYVEGYSPSDLYSYRQSLLQVLRQLQQCSIKECATSGSNVSKISHLQNIINQQSLIINNLRETSKSCSKLPVLSLPQACLSPVEIVNNIYVEGYSPSDLYSYRQSLLQVLRQLQQCSIKGCATSGSNTLEVGHLQNIIDQQTLIINNLRETSESCPKLPILSLPQACLSPVEIVNNIYVEGYSPSDLYSYKQSLLQVLRQLQQCSITNSSQSVNIELQKQVDYLTMLVNSLRKNCVQAQLPLLEVPELCISPAQYIESLSVHGYQDSDVESFKESLLGVIWKMQNCKSASSSLIANIAKCTQTPTCGNLPKLPIVQNCLAPPEIINQLNLNAFAQWEASLFKQTLLELLLLQQKCCNSKTTKIIEKPIFVRVPVEVPRIIQQIRQVPVQVPVLQPPKVIIKEVPVPQPPRIVIRQVPVPVPQPPRIIVREIRVPGSSECKPIIQQVPIKVPVPIRIKVPVQVFVPVQKQCRLPNIDVFDCSVPNLTLEVLDLSVYNASDAADFKKSILSLINTQRNCNLKVLTQRIQVPVTVVERIPVYMKEKPEVIIKEITRPSECKCELPNLSLLRGCITPDRIESLRLSTVCSNTDVISFKESLWGILQAQRKCTTQVACPPSQPVLFKEVPVRVPSPPQVIIREVPVPVLCENKTKIIIRERAVPVPSPPRIIIKEIPVRVPVQVKVPVEVRVKVPVIQKQIVEVPKIVVKEVRVPVNVPYPVRVMQPPQVLIKEVPVPVPSPPKVIVKEVPIFINKKVPIIYKDRPVMVPSPPRTIIKEVPVRIKVPVKVPVQVQVRVPVKVPVPYRVVVKVPGECHLPDIHVNTCLDITHQIDSLVLNNYDSEEITKFKQNLYTMLMQQRDCVQCRLPQVNLNGCEALEQQIADLNIAGYTQWDVQNFKQNILSVLLNQKNCCENKGETVFSPEAPRPRRLECHLPDISVDGCEELENKVRLLNISGYSLKEVHSFKEKLFMILLQQRECSVPASCPIREIRVPVPQPPRIIIKEVPVVVPQQPKIIYKQIPVIIAKCNQKPRIIIKEVPVPVQLPPRTIVKEVPVRINVPVEVKVPVRIEVPVPVRGVCHLPRVNIYDCAELQEHVMSLELPGFDASEVAIFKQDLLSVLLAQRNCTYSGSCTNVQRVEVIKEVKVPIRVEVPKEVIKYVRVPIEVPVPQPPRILFKQVPVPVPQPPRVIIKEVPVMISKCDNKPRIIIRERIVSVPSPPRTIVKEVPVRIPVLVKSECRLPVLDINTCGDLQQLIATLSLAEYNSYEVSQFKENLLALLTQQRNCVQCKLPDLSVSGCQGLQGQIESLILPNYDAWDAQTFKQQLMSILLDQRRCVGQQGCLTRDLQKEVRVPVEVPKEVIKVVKVPVYRNVFVKVPVKQIVHVPKEVLKVVRVPVRQIVTKEVIKEVKVPVYRQIPVKVPVYIKQIVEVPKTIVKEIRVPVKQIVEVPKEVIKEVVREVKVPVKVLVPQPKILFKQVPVPVPQPAKVIVRQVPIFITKCDHKQKVIYRDRPVPVPVPPRTIIKEVPVTVKVPVRILVPVRSKCHVPIININSCVDVQNGIESIVMPDYDQEEIISFKQKLLSLLLQQRNCVTCQIPEINVGGCGELQNQIEAIALPNYELSDVQIFKQNLLSVLLNQRKCIVQPECTNKIIRVPVERVVYQRVPIRVEVLKEVIREVKVPQIQRVPIKVPVPVQVPKEIIKEVRVPVQVPQYITKEVIKKVLVPVKQIVEIPREVVREVRIPVKVPVLQPPRILVREVMVPVPQPPRIIMKEVPVVISKCTNKPRIIYKEKPVLVQLPPRTIIKEVPIMVKIPINVPFKPDCHLPVINVNTCEDIQNQIASLAISGYNSMEVQQFKQNLLSVLLRQKDCVECRLPVLNVRGCRALENQIESLVLPNYNQWEVATFKQKLLSLLLDQRNCVTREECRLKTISVPGERVVYQQVPVRVPVRVEVIKEVRVPVEVEKIVVKEVRVPVKVLVPQPPKILMKEVTVPVPQPPRIIVRQVPVFISKCTNKPEIIIKEKPVLVQLPPRTIIKEVPIRVKVPFPVPFKPDCRLPILNVNTCGDLQSEITSLAISGYNSLEVEQFKQNLLSVLLRQRDCIECRLPVLNIGGCLELENQIQSLVLPNYNQLEVGVYKQKLLSLLLEQRVPVDRPVYQVPKQVVIKEVRVPFEVRVPVRVPVEKIVYVPKEVIKEVRVPVPTKQYVEVPKIVVREVKVPVNVPVPVRVPLPPKILIKEVPIPVPQPSKVIVRQVPIIISKCNQKPRIIIKEIPVPVQQPPRTVIKEVPVRVNVPVKVPVQVRVEVPVRIPVQVPIKVFVKVPVPVPGNCHLPRINIADCGDLQAKVAALYVAGYDSREVEQFKQNLFDAFMIQRGCVDQSDVISRVPSVPDCRLPYINVHGCADVDRQIEVLRLPGFNQLDVQSFKQNLFTMLMQQRICRVCPIRDFKGPGYIGVPKVEIKEVRVNVPVPVRVPSPPRVLIKEVPVPVLQPPKIVFREVPVSVKCDQKLKIIIKEKPVFVQSPPRTITKEIPVRINVPVPVRVPVEVRVPVQVKAECHLPNIQVNSCGNIENQIHSLQISDYDASEVLRFKQNLLSMVNLLENCRTSDGEIIESSLPPVCHLPTLDVRGCANLQNQIQAWQLYGYSNSEINRYKQNLLSLLLEQRECIQLERRPEKCPTRIVQVPVDKPVYVKVPVQVPVPIKYPVAVPKIVNKIVKVPVRVPVQVLVPQPAKVIIKQVPVYIPSKPKVVFKQLPVYMTPQTKYVIKQVPVRVQVPPRVIIKQVPVRVSVPVKVPVPVNVPVKVPFQVQVPVKVPFAVPVPVKYHVDRPFPVRVPIRIPVEVPKIITKMLKEPCPQQPEKLIYIRQPPAIVYKQVLVQQKPQYIIKKVPVDRIVKVPCQFGSGSLRDSVPQLCKPTIKEIRVPVPQPPKVIIKQVPVYIKTQVPVRVPQIVEKIVIKKVIQQVPVPQPPKIIERQVPIQVQLPPKVIIREVKVPVLHGTACPPPKVVIERIPVPQAPRIITKPVLVQVKVPPQVLIREVSVPYTKYVNGDCSCVIPTLPPVTGCFNPIAYVSSVVTGGCSSDVSFTFKNSLLQLLRQVASCQSGASIGGWSQGQFVGINNSGITSENRVSVCQNLKQKLLKRIRYYAGQLCVYKRIAGRLRIRIKQLMHQGVNVAGLQPSQRPAVPIPMMHMIQSITPSFPLNAFQRPPTSIGVNTAAFVRNLHQAYKNTQEALTHCMDAILAQTLTHSQIKSKCNNCHQLIQDRELAENQIRFLNSIIVDIQKKNEEQRARIEILEAGGSPGLADELKLIGSEQRQIPPRMYCDICEEFDLHETEDCPKQISDGPANGQRGPRNMTERPYCEICEAFGHATEDCQEDQTF